VADRSVRIAVHAGAVTRSRRQALVAVAVVLAAGLTWLLVRVANTDEGDRS